MMKFKNDKQAIVYLGVSLATWFYSIMAAAKVWPWIDEDLRGPGRHSVDVAVSVIVGFIGYLVARKIKGEKGFYVEDRGKKVWDGEAFAFGTMIAALFWLGMIYFFG